MTYILVIGDVLIDHYIQGSVSRVSPEAPVPILKFNSEYVVPGGAANVASNISALGEDSVLIGTFGSSDHAHSLLSTLKKRLPYLEKHKEIKKKPPKLSLIHI